jgi:hypothetical protein
VPVDCATAIEAANATADREAIVSIFIFPGFFIFLPYSLVDLNICNGGPLLASPLIKTPELGGRLQRRQAGSRRRRQEQEAGTGAGVRRQECNLR